MADKTFVGRDSTIKLLGDNVELCFTAWRWQGVSREFNDITDNKTPSPAGQIGNMKLKPSRNVDAGTIEIDAIAQAGDVPNINGAMQDIQVIVKDEAGNVIGEFIGRGGVQAFDYDASLADEATHSMTFRLESVKNLQFGDFKEAE